MGLKIVTALTDDWLSELPRLEMTWTITRPTTSSIIAALDKTVPSLVAVSPVVPRTVKMVPRLVEQRAAPAANDCKDFAATRDCNTKDSAIGATMPVRATAVENNALAFREVNDVDRPPSY
jgi:hypothetical protein